MTRVDPRTAPAVLVAARLLIAVLICASLYWAQGVLIPLGIALLISFMLHPVVRRLQRWHIPRVVAVAATVVGFAGLLGGLTWIIGGQFKAFIDQEATYRANIVSRTAQIRNWMRGGTLEKLGATLDSVSDGMNDKGELRGASRAKPLPVVIAKPAGLLGSIDLSSITPFLEPLSVAGLVLLLVVLMLVQWSDLRGRVIQFVDQNVSRTTKAFEDGARRISRYLGMQLLINSSFGLVIGVGLGIIGVQYAALWGLCAALFRYIPYAGPAVAAILPILVSMVTSQGWSQVFAVAGLFLVLELISNNFLEPWLYGTSLGISEIGIILATVAWTFLWGAAGLVLATPLTVCLVVLGEHVPALSFFSRLLADKSVLLPHFQFYQRLLAKDELEATELAEAFAKKEGGAAFVETMAVPALALARSERAAGRLRESHARRLTEILPRVAKEIIESGKAAETPVTGDAAKSTMSLVPVVGWSICPLTDVALPLFETCMANLPCAWLNVFSRELTGTAIESLTGPEVPAAVCIVHLHSDDMPKLKGVLKRIRAQAPEVPVLVARWAAEPLTEEEKTVLTGSGATAIAASPAETKSWLAPRILDVTQRLDTPDPIAESPAAPESFTAAPAALAA